MEKSTYELLDKIDSLQSPTLFICQLKDYQEQYRFLLRQDYIRQISNNKLQLQITLAGKKALEKYRIEQQLLTIQEKNLQVQKSLKELQSGEFWLACITAVVALLGLFFP